MVSVVIERSSIEYREGVTEERIDCLGGDLSWDQLKLDIDAICIFQLIYYSDFHFLNFTLVSLKFEELFRLKIFI